MITEKTQISILVIDPRESDHKRLRESFQTSSLPVTTTFTTSTEEGLKLLRRQNYDLIMTEHHLPHANAFQLLSETKEYYPFTPVILLSQVTETKTARDAFQKGVDDFILKEELSTTSLFDIVTNAIERRRQKEEQEEVNQRYRELAERDGLTGLYNHRFLLGALEREFMRSRRYHRPLSVLILDLDGFKAINDTCGHLEGDHVIQQVGRLLLQTVRFVDIAARYGGDEFVLLLPETGLREAQQLGLRILREIQSHPFIHEGKIFPLSASIGIAEHTIAQEQAGQLLKEADQALYQAKKTGRSKVVVSGYLKPALFRRASIKQDENKTLM
ncbi:MAG: GGDEF domain-containing response regulator [Deltaproteobacteria bacterium]|nr:MAG: GGDEF domain-containing response regulator [Deltaproteobacteria bacterium]